jgi:hypothetical protein
MAGTVVWSGAGFGYTCACILAVALMYAAVSKALRPAETAAGFAALDVPGAPVVARVVPVVEVGVGLALLWAPRLGGAAALVLLGAFSVFLARAVRHGVRAPCNCFGQTAGRPVSGVELARNAILAGFAAAALLADRPVTMRLTALSTLAAYAVGAIAGVLLWSLRSREARRPERSVGDI